MCRTSYPSAAYPSSCALPSNRRIEANRAFLAMLETYRDAVVEKCIAPEIDVRSYARDPTAPELQPKAPAEGLAPAAPVAGASGPPAAATAMQNGAAQSAAQLQAATHGTHSDDVLDVDELLDGTELGLDELMASRQR